MQAERGGVGHAYVAPTMLLVAFVLVAPSIYGFIYSLYEIRFLKATTFIGFENYVYLVTDPDFIALIVRSTIFTVLAVGLTIGRTMASKSPVKTSKMNSAPMV